MANTSTAPRTAPYSKPQFPVLPIDQILDIIGKECAPSTVKRYGSGKHRVVIVPEATRKLYDYYDFGSRSPVNVYEQQSQSMGLIFDNGDGTLNFVLLHMIPTPSLDRGRYHSTISRNGDSSVVDILEHERKIIRQHEKERNLDKNGFKRNPFPEYGNSITLADIHSHPGFPCFFSETDHNNHFSTIDRPAVSLVCDPIGMNMKAMAGLAHEDAEILVCEPLAAAPQEAPAPPAETSYVPAEPTPSVHELTLSVPFTRSDYIAQLSALCSTILQLPGVVGSAKTYYNWDDQLAIKIRMHLTDQDEEVCV